MENKKSIFCSDCGSPMEEIKREPKYSINSGKLMGYWITQKCKKSNTWQQLWGHYDTSNFEDINQNK